MSDGLSIGSISVGLGDTRNIDSQVSLPKIDNDNLNSLPTSFYSGDKASIEYSSPMINEFAGLGDLSISSDISLKGVGASEFNFAISELSGLGYEEAEEVFALQSLGGATPPGFEGHGASYRPDFLEPSEQIHQMAEHFSNL